jgi:hypothetical protein
MKQTSTFEPFVPAAASHACSSYATGLSAVCTVIGPARSMIEQATRRRKPDPLQIGTQGISQTF